jgi:hypothetical protein
VWGKGGGGRGGGLCKQGVAQQYGRTANLPVDEWHWLTSVLASCDTYLPGLLSPSCDTYLSGLLLQGLPLCHHLLCMRLVEVWSQRHHISCWHVLGATFLVLFGLQVPDRATSIFLVSIDTNSTSTSLQRPVCVLSSIETVCLCTMLCFGPQFEPERVRPGAAKVFNVWST